jgi:hypothetical protein
MKIHKSALASIPLLMVLAATCSFAQTGRQEFQAQAFGQGTQMGQTFNVTVIIDEYSSDGDRQILLDVFNKSGMNGVYDQLQKMTSKGRIKITGTLGYDVSYIRKFTTPTGEKIRLVTSRPIAIGEVMSNSRSQNYSVSALELDLNMADMNKSTGQLLPLCQFKINKDKELEVEAYQNPWRLTNVIDWSKKK